MKRRERGSPSTSYYSVLGASVDSSTEEIRRAYRKLALQWHPDRWTRNPALLGKAKLKFQQIQEAYSVLSDNRKRSLYDAGLYDPEDEEDEGFCDFLQEMVNLMAQTRKEEKEYSMEELQKMLSEMAQGFGMELSSMSCRVIDESGSGGYKRLRWDSNSVAGRRSRPGFQLYGASSYCH